MQLGDRLAYPHMQINQASARQRNVHNTFTVVKSVQGLETQGAPGPQLAASNKRQLLNECRYKYTLKKALT